MAFLKKSWIFGTFALSGDGKAPPGEELDVDGQAWDVSGDSPRMEEALLKLPSASLRGNHLSALQFTPDGKSVLALTLRGGALRWPANRLDRVPEEVIEAGELGSRLQTLDATGTWMARPRRSRSDATAPSSSARWGRRPARRRRSGNFSGCAGPWP